MTTAQKSLQSRSSAITIVAVPTSTIPLAEKMPARSAHSSRPIDASSLLRTRKVPRIDATIPTAITSSGSTNGSATWSARSVTPSKTAFSPTPITATAASDIVATIEPV